MDLTQIRYFLALARTLNFTRAAEACHVTQPALTKSIARLEAELGGTLILRERALTQLTELGRTMLPLLQQAHDAAERARAHAAGLRDPAPAPLRVGFAPEAAPEPFAPLFAEIADRLPLLQLTLTEAAPAALCNALLQGQIDAAILPSTAPLPDRMNRWALYEDTIDALVPDTGEDGPLTRERLGEHTLVQRNGPCALERWLAPAQARHHESQTEGQAYAMVRARLGIGAVPGRAPTPPGLARRPLEGAPPETLLLVAVAGRPHAPAADLFLKAARARAWA